MAALLQSYPQPSSTMSLLQSRPSSASGILSTKPHNLISRHTSNNKIHIQRNSFNGINSGIPISNYPGQSFAASIAPYAFTSTPELNSLGYSTATFKDSGTNTKISNKTINNNSISRSSEYENRTNLPNETSNAPLLSLRSPRCYKVTSVDESIPSSPRSTRPGSAAKSSSNSNQSLSFSSTHNTSKSPPGRYRRAYSQSIDLSNNTSSAVAQQNVNELEPLSICTFKDFSLQMPQLTDFSLDISLGGKPERSGSHENLRNRPKSCQSNIPATFPQNLAQNKQDQHHLNNYRDQNEPRLSLSLSNRPYSSHKRDESSEFKNPVLTNNFKTCSALRNDQSTVGKQSTSLESQNYSPTTDNPKSLPEMTGPTNVSRVSSTDPVKRTFNPSPLSRPVNLNSDSSTTFGPITLPTTTSKNDSPAAVQLIALKKKDGKKRKNSRLRRAFSFGSAAELRNASSTGMAGFELGSNPTERKEDTIQDGLDAEQVRIAQRQEAGGIGSGIYTGQGKLFSGSTDNLSISSTASSASIMIRKMGKGMKKSTRSIVGLFRPKNMAESSSDSSSPGVGETHVSIVNVEAERGSSSHGTSSLFSEKLGVESLKMGKTVTQMESRLLDSGRNGVSTENSSANKNKIGGEKERAEAFIAVKKGTGFCSDNVLTLMTPQISGSAAFQVPQITTGNDTPNSTAPSTPKDDQQGGLGHSTTTYGNEDYFASAIRPQGSPKSQPGTPSSSSGKRNTKFSPRIQFHDTWPSGEYDRRGEIATCNRLTPMLAQQIKEELNTFKM
ncbi:hypothetical protein EPUL_005399, partial [Erysiphe pulchra]